MKKTRFRTRLLLSFWLVLILGLGLPASYLFDALKTEIIRETTNNAFAELALVEWLLNNNALSDTRALDAWCKEMGRMAEYRITVIAEGGRVIADSEVAFQDIPGLDNHANREEIMGARKSGRASSIRYSETLEKNLIYAAKTIHNALAPSGVLRVAIPLSTVESRLDSLRTRFWGMLLFFFTLTVFISMALARKLETPIRNIIGVATAIGQGDYSRKLEMAAGTEFAPLARCINDMADRISQHIAIITAKKQELEAVLQGMQEGVMLLDQEGKIKAVNQALLQISGSSHSCLGRRPMEIFLQPEIQDACDKVLNNGAPLRLKAELPNDRVYEVNLVHIPDDGAVVVFHDISELVRLEKVRRDFVANVSHELRTPLTSIKGYGETLQDPEFRAGDQAGRFVDIIVKNADQMSRVVADLLELTRIEQKPTPLDQLSPVAAAVCCRSALDTCLPMINAKSMRVENRLDDGLLVLGDEHLLTQVFRNLIDNAVRHSPEAGRITVFAGDAGNMTVFGVEDEGCGIPRYHLKRIFERFYRVNKERSRASGGTGLGLSICRNAVRSMGGDIWAESPPEGKSAGSVFYFSLKKAAV